MLDSTTPHRVRMVRDSLETMRANWGYPVDETGATEMDCIALFHHARDRLADICQARVDKIGDEVDIPVDEADEGKVMDEIEMAGWMRREDVEVVLATLNAEAVPNIKKPVEEKPKQIGRRNGNEPRSLSPERNPSLVMSVAANITPQVLQQEASREENDEDKATCDQRNEFEYQRRRSRRSVSESYEDEPRNAQPHHPEEQPHRKRSRQRSESPSISRNSSEREFTPPNYRPIATPRRRILRYREYRNLDNDLAKTHAQIHEARLVVTTHNMKRNMWNTEDKREDEGEDRGGKKARF